MRYSSNLNLPTETPKRLLSALKRNFLLRINRVSLRARLLLAFFTLIVTSASATVVIGDLVFGKTTFYLAASKMKLGLRLTELALRSKIEIYDIIAAYYAGKAARVTESVDLCTFVLSNEKSVDISMVYDQSNLYVARPTPRKFGTTAVPASSKRKKTCNTVREDSVQLAGSSLADLFQFVLSEKRSYSGFIESDERTSAFVRSEMHPTKGLLLVSAAPIAKRGAYMVASYIDSQSNLISPSLTLPLIDQREHIVASLFLKNRRVATLMGNYKSQLPLDDEVTKKVLEQGHSYLGVTDASGSPSYAAYKPIRDFRDRPIGVLGVEAPEAYYFDLKQQTVSLFAGLIALGMLFGFFISYLFTGLLIRPVSELAKGMQRVAEGDLDYKIRVDSGDELGKLSKAFNRMVTNIRERDVRLREMTNEQLSQVDKQVSIGRLAAGVAHEINNPLTSVLSLSMMMLKETKESDARRDDLEVVVEETTRCRTIVRSLLDFAREVPSEKKCIDINQVIRDTLILVKRYESTDGIEIALKLSPEPLLIDADSEQLRQVFANVLINAAEASNNEGRIVVTTDEDSSGGFVIARIRDRGIGVPKEHLGSVFQPFFTTKGAKKGTGLGLSVSHGIIAKHRGTIELESEEGKGTIVTILLPRSKEKNAYG